MIRRIRLRYQTIQLMHCALPGWHWMDVVYILTGRVL